jgi:hypothetical protein
MQQALTEHLHAVDTLHTLHNAAGTKGKKRKGNRKKENKGGNRKKGFRKLGKFLGKLGEGLLRIFLGFSDTGVNSGTAVMARRTGRRDRGGARFPSW